MPNVIRTLSSTARVGLLGLGAAILLSACGGSADLGNGPEMLNENLPSSVTVSAANPNPPADPAAAQEPVFDWRTANGGQAPAQDVNAVPAAGAPTATAGMEPAAASVAQESATPARPCLDLPSCNGMLPDNVNDKEQAWQQGGGPY